MLEGPLPPEVGNMEHVQAIGISKNNLSGQITARIESCPELWYLDLSWNALQVSRFLCSRYWKKSKNALALNVGYPKISHRELIDATNGFNEATLLGVGSFGAVYKNGCCQEYGHGAMVSERGCLQRWNFVAGNVDKKGPTDDMFSGRLNVQ
eukprot:Gb_12310 [translate_table: standard]